MIEYDFSFDEENLEIFPKELWSNPLVVFHGTSSFHSNNIEKNGLIVHTAPFDTYKAKILIDTLKLPEIQQFDIEKGFFNWTTAHSLGHYLNAIEKNEFRLSFSCLSSLCIPFTQGEIKGGQAFGHVRDAKEIIDRAILANPDCQNLIPVEVIELFDEIDTVDNSVGIIYAIKLPPDLNGIENMDVIYSQNSIPLESIVGKVRIPADFIFSVTQSVITSKMRQKLQTGLGKLLWMKQDQEEEEEERNKKTDNDLK